MPAVKTRNTSSDISSTFGALVDNLRRLNRQRIERRRALRPRTHGGGTLSYGQWIKTFDTITPGIRSSLLDRQARLQETPTIAIILPVYKPNMVWLKQAVQSVQDQLYPHWELCICDDASDDAGLTDYLEQLVKSDLRVRVVQHTSNGHIATASNSALALTSAPFIGFLDHDDVLREHTLLLVAEALDRFPQARLVYSDEDKIDGHGSRSDPHFKADWNPELLLAQNYISHFSVLSSSLVKAQGGLRRGYEGAQDHDLLLRCCGDLDSSEVVHIPHILYHWRKHEGSTADGMQAKAYAAHATLKSVRDHLARGGEATILEPDQRGWLRVRWEPPQRQPLVSILIPTRNGHDLLRTCVDSILSHTTYEQYEIIVIDNGSDQPEALAYLQRLSGHPRIRVLRDERPFNFAGLNNAAAVIASGEFLALVNNDIEVISPNWLSDMVGLACRKGIGAVGAKLLYSNRRVQHAGVVLGIGGAAGHTHKHITSDAPGYFGRASLTHQVSAVTAACLLIRRSIYEEVGGMDEKSLAVAFNDIDFCLRVQSAGYRNAFAATAELFHHESVSRGPEDSPQKRRRFNLEASVLRERWGNALLWDHAYNPNLTLDHEDFSIATHPRVTLSDPWYRRMSRAKTHVRPHWAEVERHPPALLEAAISSTNQLLAARASQHRRVLTIGCHEVLSGSPQTWGEAYAVERRYDQAAAAHRVSEEALVLEFERDSSSLDVQEAFDCIIVGCEWARVEDPARYLSQAAALLDGRGALLVCSAIKGALPESSAAQGGSLRGSHTSLSPAELFDHLNTAELAVQNVEWIAEGGTAFNERNPGATHCIVVAKPALNRRQAENKNRTWWKSPLDNFSWPEPDLDPASAGISASANETDRRPLVH